MSDKITWFSKPIEVDEDECVPGVHVPPGQNQILQVGTRADGTPIYKRRRGRPPGRQSSTPRVQTETLREITGPPVTDWYSAIATDIPEPQSDDNDNNAEVEIEVERSEEEMERWKLLSSFGDIVTHLPIELFRSSGFMRHLDQSYRLKTAEIHRLCTELQGDIRPAHALAVRERLIDLMREATEDRMEIRAEVFKLHGLVDAQISSLSTDIEKTEGPRDEHGELLNPPVKRRAPQTSPRKKRRVSLPVQAPPKKVIADPHLAPLDIPIDDDEPLYCYCQRVSFGKMIACENQDCQGGEWFHFPCLGISSAPRGKWYCDVCSKAVVTKETALQKRDRIRLENRDRERRRREKLRQRRS